MSGSFCAVDIEKPLELLDPTHRGLHRFIPRHPDEIEIDIGDPVYVQKEAEDLWCEGESVQNCNFQPLSQKREHFWCESERVSRPLSP